MRRENKISIPREVKQGTLEVAKEDFYAELTDPKQHDPKHYCYIVHALNLSTRDHLLMLSIRQGGYDPSQEIDLLKEPEKIVDKKLISASIINQDHVTTWGSIFFILDVPWNNFVFMSPKENATKITNPDFVLEHSQHPHILPSKLVEQADERLNEVVITGTKDGDKVKIIGVGIKLTDVGDEKNREPKEAGQMRIIAQKLGVPIIELVEVVRIKDGDPEISLGYGGHIQAVYINKDGYRYCFEADWNSAELKDVFKGDKNFYGRHNPVSKEEWVSLRPIIEKRMDSDVKLNFLKKIDERFGL